MANIHIAAIHDRIDEEHFEMRLHASAIQALQRKVSLLEAAVRELRRVAYGDEEAAHEARVRLAEPIPRRSRAPGRRRPARNLQG